MDSSLIAQDDASLEVAYPPTSFLAVLSRPREGPLDTQDAIFSTLSKYGIEMRSRGGPFWEQSLQNVMEQAIEQGFDVLITFDYDSIFQPQDFDKMIQACLAHPEIDALAPIQPRREHGTPMFSLDGKFGGVGETEPVAIGSLLKVSSAHFGMTFIRLNKLKNIPKPWLINVPNINGSWAGPTGDGDPRCDCDCTFWKLWREAGNNLYLHTGVYLGHIERLVSIYCVFEEFGKWYGETRHFYLQDYRTNGVEGSRPVIGPSSRKASLTKKDLYDLNYGDFSADTFPQCFIQSGDVVLGEHSTDYSGSIYANV